MKKYSLMEIYNLLEMAKVFLKEGQPNAARRQIVKAECALMCLRGEILKEVENVQNNIKN